MKRLLIFIIICIICINSIACNTRKEAINYTNSNKVNGEGKDLENNIEETDQISMSNYMEYQLPDSLVTGEYSQQLGYLGGNLFCLKETGSCEAMPASASAGYGWNSYGGVEMYYQLNSTFEDGGLKEVSIPWNHSMYIDKAETLTNCEESAIMVLVDHDLYTATENTTDEKRNSRFWYAFFSKEGSDISYAIYLNADFFNEEDMRALAQTVKFKDGAFDVKVQ